MGKKQTRKRQKVKNTSNFQNLQSHNDLKSREDGHVLTGIFPVEIWHIIFDLVRNHLLFTRINSASKYFSSILRPMRSKILFPAVANTLFWKLNRQFPRNRMQRLHKCRLVCSDWQSPVDYVFQSKTHHNLRFNHQYNPNYSIQNFTSPECQVLENLEDIREFQEHFSSFWSGRNPFVFRSLAIKIRWDGNTAENINFADNIITFLDNFGKHVWYLSITTAIRDHEKHVQFVVSGVLNQILDRLPDLKVLQIDVNYGINYNETWERNIKRHFQQVPVPQLKCLEVLVCNGVHELLIANLVEKNSSIRELKFSGIEINKFPARRMNQLRALILSSSSALHDLDASKAIWCLTKLELRVDRLNVPWRHVFRVLEEKFANTLEQLSIKLGVSKTMEIPCGLALPKLRYLYMDLRMFVPLNFLLPMSDTLQHLSVRLDVDHLKHLQGKVIGDQEKNIQFFSCRKELRLSNLWRIFTKLQNLKCKCEVALLEYEQDYCTRNRWRDYNRI